jgi:hypothetical protein
MHQYFEIGRHDVTSFLFVGQNGSGLEKTSTVFRVFGQAEVGLPPVATKPQEALIDKLGVDLFLCEIGKNPFSG